jgi:rhodanese-related sulfurtransferase
MAVLACSKSSDEPTPAPPVPASAALRGAASLGGAAQVSAATASAAPAKAREAPLTFITTADLVARTGRPRDGWDFTLIDARSRVEYEDQHIDGAQLIPARSVTDNLPKLVPNKDRTLVFYCNGPTCTKSQKAARSALALGYTDVREYNDGLPAWVQAGQRTSGKSLPSVEVQALSPAALADALNAKSITAVDIRDRDEFANFSIGGSLNIPLDEIQTHLAELPGSSVCIVDHSGHQTVIAGRLLASLGHSGAKRLDGGLLAWQRAGLPVAASQGAGRP